MKLSNRLKDQYSFEEVISVIDEIRGSDDIDMSAVDFIEPYSMVCLLLIGKGSFRDTGRRITLGNIPMNIHQYLVRMDFFSQGIFSSKEPLNEKFQLKRSAASSRVIEIIEIPNKEREGVKAISNVIALFRKRSTAILKNHLADNSVDYFVTVISELCQNIFEHSLDTGYIAMQTYTSGRENILRLVIADSGIGIKESFGEQSRFSSMPDAEVIKEAYSTPISSKRDFGYGLCQVAGIAEKLKADVFIRSGSGSLTAVYNSKGGSNSIFLKNGLIHFTGTQISISLNSKSRV